MTLANGQAIYDKLRSSWPGPPRRRKMPAPLALLAVVWVAASLPVAAPAKVRMHAEEAPRPPLGSSTRPVNGGFSREDEWL